MAFVPLGSEQMEPGDLIDFATFPPLFGSEGLAGANVGTDEIGGRVVNFSLNPAAAALFEDYTTAHIGDYFAITIDGSVSPRRSSTARSRAASPDHQAGTTGGYPADEAAALVAILDSGPLPVAINGDLRGTRTCRSLGERGLTADRHHHPRIAADASSARRGYDVESQQLECDQA